MSTDIPDLKKLGIRSTPEVVLNNIEQIYGLNPI
jgi:hypothetical protein